LSLYRGPVKADEVSEETLLDWILVREKRHWNKMIENRGLPRTLENAPVEQAAARLTLVSLGDGIRNRDQAISNLEGCPLLKGLDAPTLAAVADIFHDLYPGPGWVNGLTPDLIGAYLLNVTDDDYIRDLYARID